MAEPADEAQIKAALGRLHQAPGDQEAWAVVFRATWPFVLALCHRSLPASRRVIAAEDVAQQVFFKFSRYWHDRRPPIDDRDALFSLLAVMTRKLASDARRHAAREKRGGGHEALPLDDVPDQGDFNLHAVELSDWMDKLCNRIDPRQRQVLILRLQDYTIDEIAAQLQVTTRTIERDLKELRQTIGLHLD